jgi:hypothetical protein
LSTITMSGGRAVTSWVAASNEFNDARNSRSPPHEARCLHCEIGGFAKD